MKILPGDLCRECGQTTTIFTERTKPGDWQASFGFKTIGHELCTNQKCKRGRLNMKEYPQYFGERRK